MKLATNKPARMIMASLAAASLALAGAAPAFAITAEGARTQDISYQGASDNVGKTDYWLQISEDGDGHGGGGLNNMSVDVPIRVNLAVTAEGNFVTPTAIKNIIENKSEFPLDVTAMSISSETPFTNVAETGFATSLVPNAYKGKIASATLAADGASYTTKQSVAFTKLGTFAPNAAWRMAASDNDAKAGNDCLFIQIDGALNNIAGQYFTSPINVFDITYTFAAASADAATTPASITD